MKFKNLPYLLLIIFVVIYTPSCQAPKDLVYRDFNNLAIEKLGFGSSSLKLDLIYYNPNNFSLQLNSTDLDIYINNNYLGHSSQEYQITIPKLAEFSLPLQIDVDMKNMLKNALTSLIDKEVTVRISGKIKLGKANVYKIFPVNYERKKKFAFY